MAKKREKKFLSFIAVIIVFIFVGTIFMVLGSGNLYKNISNNKQASSQIYKSKTLKATLEIPAKYKIVENLGSLILQSKEGSINVGQNATNFADLNGYINNSKNNLQNRLRSKEDLTINGLEAVSGEIENEKIYFVYSDYNVYSLSTSYEELFDDLDQIAQSFRYTP